MAYKTTLKSSCPLRTLSKHYQFNFIPLAPQGTQQNDDLDVYIKQRHKNWIALSSPNFSVYSKEYTQFQYPFGSRDLASQVFNFFFKTALAGIKRRKGIKGCERETFEYYGGYLWINQTNIIFFQPTQSFLVGIEVIITDSFRDSVTETQAHGFLDIDMGFVPF